MVSLGLLVEVLQQNLVLKISLEHLLPHLLLQGFQLQHLQIEFGLLSFIIGRRWILKQGLQHMADASYFIGLIHLFEITLFGDLL